MRIKRLLNRVGFGCKPSIQLCAAVGTTVVLSSGQLYADGGTSKVNVLSLINGFSVIEGASSQVTRTPSGVSMQMRTRELNPGHAYTLWMAVFNYPEYCLVPYACADADFDNPDVQADVMYAGGNVVGHSGRSGFGGHKATGDNSGSVFAPLGLPAPGLLNPMGAEIHLVAHSHGTMLPEYMPAMIHSFSGGCVDPGPPFEGIWVEGWGEQGPNQCLSEQFAVHPPPMAP